MFAGGAHATSLIPGVMKYHAMYCIPYGKNNILILFIA